MNDFVFVTGNQHKADYLARWLGRPVAHQKVDLEEIQSLDPQKVIEAKAWEAYAVVGKPVLIEDISLVFTAMGALPGTFIKWFLEELGTEKLCTLANGLPDNAAVASMIYALYDGKRLRCFTGSTNGHIAEAPRGESWGWNTIFVPNGFSKTYAEMSELEFNACSHRGQALRKLQAFLKTSTG